jgi:hypothetical protein
VSNAILASRRRVVAGMGTVLAAPAIITTPGILMPIRPWMPAPLSLPALAGDPWDAYFKALDEAMAVSVRQIKWQVAADVLGEGSRP